VRVPVEPMQQQRRVPISQETWDDDHWEAQREVKPPMKAMRQEQPEASNWGDDEIPQAEILSDEDVTKDAWEDDENPKPYRAPQVNIPERKRVVEYEEETDY